MGILENELFTKYRFARGVYFEINVWGGFLGRQPLFWGSFGALVSFTSAASGLDFCRFAASRLDLFIFVGFAVSGLDLCRFCRFGVGFL